MIAYLKGIIQKKFAKNLIVKVNDLGYLVAVPSNFAEKIHEKDSVELYIYTKVREDDISLYGFETIDQLEFFRQLLNVNGIGPKIALELLSQDMEKTKGAIITGNILFLSSVPGIGKKTAERIMIELKGKISITETARIHASIETTVNDEVIEALKNLGYQRFEIIKTLQDLPKKMTKTEEIITYFLQNI